MSSSELNPEKRMQQPTARSWVSPALLLSLISLALFWSLYSFDYYFFDDFLSRQVNEQSLLGRYFRFSPGAITDALSALAGVVAAILGIVITVVSIVVQLSAARFSGITRMFLRDRVNVAVIGFYVIVCVCGIWLSVALKSDYVPRFALITMMLFTTLSVVLMVPYFGYVFSFLEPMNIIRRIGAGAFDAASKGSQNGEATGSALAQQEVLNALEELTDIASASISGKDKIIASGAVDGLKDLVLDYTGQKKHAHRTWFKVHSLIRTNPDFVAMDPESLADLEQRCTWLEWKVMRQYFGIYNEALGGMRDINYLIAIDTRYIGEKAAALQDQELMNLVFRFMNSYLRATLNAKDVRTAYNVLNQYRLLIEAMLAENQKDAALEGLRHMIYYGHVSFDMKLTFVTETVAYDVGSLVQTAHELAEAIEEPMLESFLQLDRPLRTQSQESALVGVRKAQVKLAAYYLSQGLVQRARLIADDMAAEPEKRLRTIWNSLAGVTTKDFWEIIDRGRNFEFMPPDERKQLPVFFSWLGLNVEEAKDSSRS